MKLNLAAGRSSQRGCGEAGDLPQKFFQGFFIFSSDIFGRRGFTRHAGGGFGFAEKLLGEAGARGGGQTQRHLAAGSAPATTVNQISESAVERGWEEISKI